jgi:deoxyadenosine/deoxycytidine kinase
VSAESAKSKPAVVILGNIAAGKTTMAEFVADALNLPALLERPADNPFLARMKSDPTRWCFANQSWFLQEALTSMAAAAEGGVLDHSIEEVVPIHSSVFLARGWLDSDEFGLLEVCARNSLELLRLPDLYVVINAAAKTSIKRVRARRRRDDRLPDSGYLDSVAESRRRFLAATAVPRLEVSAEAIDFRNEEGQAHVDSLVRQALSK